VGQKRVEFARTIQRVEIIATADVGITDPNLWNSTPAAGLFAHFGSEIGAAGHIDFLETGTLTAQQILSHVAVAAISGCIDSDFLHVPRHRPLR
jgi:hypothetical protein